MPAEDATLSSLGEAGRDPSCTQPPQAWRSQGLLVDDLLGPRDAQASRAALALWSANRMRRGCHLAAGSGPDPGTGSRTSSSSSPARPAVNSAPPLDVDSSSRLPGSHHDSSSSPTAPGSRLRASPSVASATHGSASAAPSHPSPATKLASAEAAASWDKFEISSAAACAAAPDGSEGTSASIPCSGLFERGAIWNGNRGIASAR
mmetsp:Transcript_83984/g.271789  ORF Transcript_83984/g.271789 Transcript_83984/m.271789 type:complete len:205 (-) Transcript_83984:58-672(-)